MKPLRVLHALWDLDLGGNRTEALGLVRFADRARVEPRLFCGRRPGIVRPEEVDALGAVWHPLRGRLDLGYAAALRRHAEAIGADLIHTHNFNGHIAAWLALRRMHRRPLFVATVGGRYRPARPSPRSAALYLAYRTGSALALRNADGVIAVSEVVAARLRRRSIDAARIAVVAHGVDPRFAPGDGSAARREFGIAPSAPVLATVGRLDPMKGHAYLLAAAAIVRRSVPDLRLLLIGGGPLERSLRAKARAMRIEDAVVITGMRTDVPELLRAADLFVFPSVDDREGFGIAMLEAMATGLAVVGTRAGGIPEVVPDGRAGLLVPPKDGRALAQAILALLTDPRRRSAMGREGRSLAEGPFSMHAAVRRTEDFYAACAARGQPARGKI